MKRLAGVKRRKLLAGALAAAIAVPCFLFGWYVLTSRLDLPRFRQVRDSYRRSEAVLLDRFGVVIHESRVDSSARRLDWTALNAISPALLDAIIRVEDRRFYRQWGDSAAGIRGERARSRCSLFPCCARSCSRRPATAL
jgi:membrane peptidoglycan carboxypeptidase